MNLRHSHKEQPDHGAQSWGFASPVPDYTGAAVS